MSIIHRSNNRKESITLDDLMYIRERVCEIISKHECDDQGHLTRIGLNALINKERNLILILNQLIEQERGDYDA